MRFREGLTKLPIYKRMLLIIAFIFLSNPLTAAGTTIYLDSTIDTPGRTLTYQGQNYDINDIGAYSIGESVNISVNTSDINSFQLSLLDKNTNFLWNHIVYSTEGTAAVTMPENVVTAPGTYAFVVFYQGDIKAVKPVVFSSYKISVKPENRVVAPGGKLQVKVEVAPDTTRPIKVVLSRNSSSFESAVNRTRESLYETEIIIPASANGSFSLYAVMATDNVIMGYPELVGVSDGGTINVKNPLAIDSKASDISFPLVIISVFLIALLVLLILKRVRS